MPTAVAAARQSYADHPMVRLETAPPGPCHAVSLQETLSGTFTVCATVILGGVRLFPPGCWQKVHWQSLDEHNVTDPATTIGGRSVTNSHPNLEGPQVRCTQPSSNRRSFRHAVPRRQLYPCQLYPCRNGGRFHVHGLLL